MYKYIIIWSFVSLYTIVNGTITACIPFNRAGINEPSLVEDYPALVKLLKQELTEQLVGDSVLFYEQLDFDFHHPALSAKGQFLNASVLNLDDFGLKFFKDIDIAKNKIEVFNLTFHNISITGEYNMRGNIGDLFDIFGEGHFWATPLNFSVSASTKLPSINSTHACLTLNINVTLQKLESWFSNFMNDDELEELLNLALMSLAPEVIDVLWGELKDVVDGPLQQWIDSVINRHSQYILSRIITSPEDLK